MTRQITMMRRQRSTVIRQPLPLQFSDFFLLLDQSQHTIRGWKLYIVHLVLSIFHLDIYHPNHHTLHWHLVSGASRTRPKRGFSRRCKLLNSANDLILTDQVVSDRHGGVRRVVSRQLRLPMSGVWRNCNT